MIVIITAHHISLLFNRFSVKYILPFQIWRFLPYNYLALLKDRFLKTMLLKRAKPRHFCFFFPQIIGSNNTLIENNLRSLAKFEFKVRAHYMANGGKNPSRDPLMLKAEFD